MFSLRGAVVSSISCSPDVSSFVAEQAFKLSIIGSTASRRLKQAASSVCCWRGGSREICSGVFVNWEGMPLLLSVLDSADEADEMDVSFFGGPPLRLDSTIFFLKANSFSLVAFSSSSARFLQHVPPAVLCTTLPHAGDFVTCVGPDYRCRLAMVSSGPLARAHEHVAVYTHHVQAR